METMKMLVLKMHEMQVHDAILIEQTWPNAF